VNKVECSTDLFCYVRTLWMASDIEPERNLQHALQGHGICTDMFLPRAAELSAKSGIFSTTYFSRSSFSANCSGVQHHVFSHNRTCPYNTCTVCKVLSSVLNVRVCCHWLTPAVRGWRTGAERTIHSQHGAPSGSVVLLQDKLICFSGSVAT
jgi:hypothetical protein